MLYLLKISIFKVSFQKSVGSTLGLASAVCPYGPFYLCAINSCSFYLIFREDHLGTNYPSRRQYDDDSEPSVRVDIIGQTRDMPL